MAECCTTVIVTPPATRPVEVMRAASQVVVMLPPASPLIVENAAQKTIQVPTDKTVTVTRQARLPLDIITPGPPGPPAEPYQPEQLVASETLGGHRLVRSHGSNAVGYANASDPTHGDDTRGLTLGAAVLGDLVTVQRAGPVTFSGWTWMPGAVVFHGIDSQPTQNAPTQAAGYAFAQAIGHATAADALYLSIEPPLYFED